MSLIKQPFGFAAAGRAAMSDISQTNLVSHYRADTGVTLATGVVKWEDQVGSNDFDQAVTAGQPTYSATSGCGGLDGITFDGTNDDLYNLTIEQAQPFHLFFAFHTETQATTEGELAVSTNSPASQVTMYYGGADKISIIAGAVGPSVTTWADNTDFVLNTAFSGASSTMQKNDDTAVTGNAGTNEWGGSGHAGMRLSGNGTSPPATAGWCNYTISEFAIYGAVQTGGTLTSILDYFNGQYDIF